MKVVHLYDEHSRVAPGGGSVVSVILNISKHQAKMGHDVTIIERKWRGTPEFENQNGVKFRRFKLHIGSDIPGKEVPYNMVKSPIGLSKMILDRIEFAYLLKRYLEKMEFDVLHVHVPFTANILIRICRKIRKKIVYTLHAGEERKRLGIDKNAPLALKFFSPDLSLMRRVRFCTVLNPMLRRVLIDLGIDSNKIAVVPNGVDVSEFGNYDEDELITIRKRYGIPDKLTVMFAGTITPRKGVIHLLKAMDILVNEEGIKDVFLYLTGTTDLDPPYFEMCQSFVRKKLDGYVKFLGCVSYEDLKRLYSACDIFVLPSYEEGDPIALKEALASGKPLIGSNVSGIPMQIRNGWNGFLVEPGNERQLAERIKYLVENEEERKRMGRNSRKLAEEEFSWENIADRYVEVYESVIEW